MDAFEQRAGEVLQAIGRAIDDSGTDCDWEQKGDAVLEITLPDGGRVIVNRHGPAQEIWVATKSGGYHFRFDETAWRDTRSGAELFAFLSEYLSGQTGEALVLKA